MICSFGAEAPVPAPSGRNTRNAVPPSVASALIEPPWISAKRRTIGEIGRLGGRPGILDRHERSALGLLHPDDDRLAVLRALGGHLQQAAHDALGPLGVDPDPQRVGDDPDVVVRVGARTPRRPG